ncbi:MAG: IS21-like element helper ATPase IstB [Chitinophagaceae bacterium]
MSEQKQLIRHYCQQFKLGGIQPCIDNLIIDAEANGLGYMDYTVSLLGAEAVHREQNDLTKRLKTARLPRSCDLGTYDESFDNGLQRTRLNQLKELHWLDQVYNIIFMGPSGTGKTFLSAGLCSEAVRKGYKAYFRTMEELMGMLKMKDFARSAKGEYGRLLKANLIVIDDIMLFPMEKNEAVSLFNFVNQLYEKTSFIITTNKKPAEWALMLNDEVLATALLDRLLYQCEVINLSGKSYRLQNRKTIFEE